MAQVSHIAQTQHSSATSTPAETSGADAPATDAAAKELSFIERYERERRLSLLRLMIPAFVVITAALAIAIAVYLLVVAPNQQALFVVEIPLALVMFAHVASLALVRRGQIGLPTALVITDSALVIVIVEVTWVLTQRLDFFAIVGLIALCAIIVIAGALGRGWTILVVTLAMNGATLAILLLSPRAPDLAAPIKAQLPLFAPLIIMTQWAIATAMFAIYRNFQHTLSEVGIAYERARQLDEMKSLFISSVNHELRTPLTTLQTYIQACLSRFNRLSREELYGALQSADRVSRGLAALVMEILSSRRVEQQATNPILQQVAVRPLIDEAIALLDLRPGATPTRDLHLRVPDELTVWADALLLKVILSNLLSNALKYSPPGSPLDVSATLTTADAESGEDGKPRRRGLWGRRRANTGRAEVEVIVRDYGLGIPPEQVDLLFNRFTRLPRDLASSVVGTGLGLYTCRLYAEAMGGRIWVESTGVEGEGATFYLRLPVAPDPTKAPIADTPHTTSVTSPRNDLDSTRALPAPASRPLAATGAHRGADHQARVSRP
ncbi:MAG TPA: ATP-binding protein [Ktedonobacterales bacterium]|nr:ATP-binding protein [Ktedonobacterales bacterium]